MIEEPIDYDKFYKYQGYGLPGKFFFENKEYLKERFKECLQHDFDMLVIEEDYNENSKALYKSINFHLERYGWQVLPNTIQLFKTVGNIALHKDFDCPFGRYSYVNSAIPPEHIYNAILPIQIIQRGAPEMDDSHGLSFWDGKDSGIDFLYEVPTPNRDRPLLELAKIEEGEIMLFDQEVHHGIMTNNEYCVLVLVVAKKEGEHGRENDENDW